MQKNDIHTRIRKYQKRTYAILSGVLRGGLTEKVIIKDFKKLGSKLCDYLRKKCSRQKERLVLGPEAEACLLRNRICQEATLVRAEPASKTGGLAVRDSVLGISVFICILSFLQGAVIHHFSRLSMAF